MRRWLLAVVCTCAMFCSGCVGYFAPVMPPQGGLFTAVSAPLDTDVENTPNSYSMGSSTAVCILGLFAFGDASVTTAARNGGLERIDHLDYSYLNILFIYQGFTTKAYGE